MRKKYKLLNRNGMIYLLRWVEKGVLFGPQWESMVCFDNCGDNMDRCKRIIRLMNECEHINSQEYDGERNPKN